MSILEEIVEKRKKRIERLGYNESIPLALERAVPVVPFCGNSLSDDSEFVTICEFKRRSPSKGWIKKGGDPVNHVRRYVKEGISHVSVLTESEFFGGSLEDLIRLKKNYPTISVLRKDFLLDEEDIEVSFRAGADTVLLIASVLSEAELRRLYERTKALGMEALVEVHDVGDIDKIRGLKPTLVGINSRDLKNFKIDLIHPVRLRGLIDWKTCVIFESGVRYEEDVALAVSAGFGGVLIGEAVMKNPNLIEEINRVVSGNSLGGMAPKSLRKRDFWKRLYKKLSSDERFGIKKHGLGDFMNAFRRPLIKICGITNPEDAELAVKLGADILGFVFAPSVRRAEPKLLKEIEGLNVLKVGVVVSDSGDPEELLEVRKLVEDGFLDAVQFHGEEKPEECFLRAFPYYKALRVKAVADVDRAGNYRSPRVLLDAYSDRAMGGTGKSIPDGLVRLASRRFPLWLAGGLSPDNVRTVICTYKPELIDASSKLEAYPGKKDSDALRKFFAEIERINYAGCS